ncbi:MAG TPA: hypothetical protein H9667_05590 [Firmicutes bacterium]|nr:hypothetical protein [Bacillota bacterium]
MIVIKNEAQLGKALKNNEQEINIEGDLVQRVLTIKHTSDIPWAMALGAITVPITTLTLMGPYRKVSFGLHSYTAPTAIGIIGAKTTETAIEIGVAGGGVSALNKLRSYKIASQDDEQLLLVAAVEDKEKEKQ